MKRWRRPAPAVAPGADDGRALLIANRRIVQLETDLTTARHRIDRMAGQCAPPCHHQNKLMDAELLAIRLVAERDDFRLRLERILAQMRDLRIPPARADSPEPTA